MSNQYYGLVGRRIRGKLERKSMIFMHAVQCDQIGVLIALWATFQSLWNQLFCQNCPHHFWTTFIDIWKLFTGHTDAACFAVYSNINCPNNTIAIICKFIYTQKMTYVVQTYIDTFFDWYIILLHLYLYHRIPIDI